MKNLAAAAIAAVSVMALLAPAAAARADDDAAPGWGMAIAARVIGEKCADTLKADEIVTLNDYIAEAFQQSVTKSGQSPAWWADLRDKLEQSYVEKYSDPANCTDDARDEAEEMVSDVRDYKDDAGK
jgi:hypothetical protein